MRADHRFHLLHVTVRSLITTILLAIAATLAVALVGILLVRGNLNHIFGAPPTPVGNTLYSGFAPNDITQISLSANGARAVCRRENGVWMITSPFRDRMDPRAAKLIVDFTLGTRVADVFPNEKIDFTQAGLRDGMVSISLADSSGKTRARYTLGRRTAWSQYDETLKETVPTIFLQTRDSGRKAHTYACTGDISPMFKDGLRFIRDHQPFLFFPTILEKIQVRNTNSEFTIEGYGQEIPWRITKPQKLATETSEMKNFIQNGLFNLRALRVLDRSEVTLPANNNVADTSITLTMRGFPPVTLDIFSPKEAEADRCFALVSDRPQVVFELPVRSSELISLSSLPIRNYNEIRSRNLVSFSHAKLKGISIESLQSPTIQLFRIPRGEWRLRKDANAVEYPSEERLFQFLKAIVECKVTDFLTDNAFHGNSAIDEESYGLKNPLRVIRFTFFDNTQQTLKIGKTEQGIYTAHIDHPDTRHTIYQVSEEFVSSLPTAYRQWKDRYLFSVPAHDFSGLNRTLAGTPDLHLKYQNATQKWEAFFGAQSRTAELNVARANKILETLSNVTVRSWLGNGDAQAEKALQDPPIKMTIASFQINEFGERVNGAPKLQTLELAPVNQQGNSPFYYGRFSNSEELFFLDAGTVSLLTMDVFSESNP